VTPIVLALFAMVALAPLAISLGRTAAGRSRRESALALHRAQLAELDRDLAEGRIAAAEHVSAVLEVKRRLLAADADTEPAPPAPRASRTTLLLALLAVPLAGAGLYLIDGHPELPAAPRAARLAEAERAGHDADALIARLRARLATMDQSSELARQGYVLLGNAEESQGRLAEAAAAWRRAVGIRFDAALAVLAAEAATRVEGRVSPDSAALFRRALADGPPDAPWRKLVQQRLAEAGR
jgi:cytochrome c-type biogenesis protein CcmH